MATLTKNRARSIAASGSIFPGYVDITYPGLRTSKHVSLSLGLYTIRVELDAAELLAKQLLDIVKEHG